MSNDEMTLYLSGPMTGIPEHNFPLFNAVAHKLRAANAIVYNPAEHFSGRTDLPRAEYMAEDFRKLLEVASADTPVKGIVLLPGWTGSKGARAEVIVAHELGLQFFAWQDERLQRTTLAETFISPPFPCDGGDAPIAPLRLSTPPTGFHPTAPWGPGEVRITDPKTGGQKGQKPAQLSYLPFDSLAEVSKVYQYGASKYARDNWKKGYKWSLNFDAMMRHMFAFWEGEDLDPESGCAHVGHACWHALTLLWFMKHHKEGDDRAKR